ncbi:MAG: hypothetical protein L6416_07755 [Candidatus Omnitrophica bacterium]|nr:hypothetical protein [Candidatus Omnitrophota bacterium]
MTTVFRRTTISKEKLKDIIAKNTQYLMDGLTFIDFQLAADEQGVIDFLGVDGTKRLVLVNFDTGSNDGMFIGALSQIYWLKKNYGLIRRLFFSENIDFSLEPQIILVSVGFSGKLKSAVKQTKSQDIKLVEFKYITAQGKDAIIFEEIFDSKNALPAEKSPAVEEKVSVQEKNMLKEEMPQEILRDVSLSEEEIAEFMEFEKTIEEKKLSA